MADAPSGTVTFLFTDIEGSTKLLQRAGEAYADLLDEHRRLLRAAFDAHGGYEVDTEGDAFFVAFSSANDAVAAAAEAQQALARHEWPSDTEIRVRMGVHTGEPVLSRVGTSASTYTERHASRRQATAARSSSRTPRRTC